MILVSWRASGAPMQKWMPQPKATWRRSSSGSRSRRNSSGASNRSGSRLADAEEQLQLAAAGIVWPRTGQSDAFVRKGRHR